MTLPADQIETLEFERKYLIPHECIAAAIGCLGAYCRTDERFPASEVHSIYFDTPGLRLLQEKSDGDLYKTKVRLRWYEDPEAGPVESTSFLEVKRRVGARRLKWRRRVDLEAAWLSQARLTETRLRAALDRIEIDPTVAVAGLRPVLVVKYLRHRWVDPVTGARVCLDRSISVP
ncbi:MAG: VTC domain-containing protein, partial [Acidobacteria bacterium]|nr:VTC domain-containing protein [Acidobacteriota bacterium]